MFGFFKKKPQTTDGATVAHDVLKGAAGMLQLGLFQCRHQPDYATRLQSDFVRGYLMGFFDAALQYANVPVANDVAFFALMAAGHTYLFDGDPQKGSDFALDSLALQGVPAFDSAMKAAGEEYFAFMQEEIRHPRKLQAFFFPEIRE